VLETAESFCNLVSKERSSNYFFSLLVLNVVNLLFYTSFYWKWPASCRKILTLSQMLTKLCKKSESSLSFRYGNTVAEGTNQRSAKPVHRDEYSLSLAQIDKRFHEFE